MRQVLCFAALGLGLGLPCAFAHGASGAEEQLEEARHLLDEGQFQAVATTARNLLRGLRDKTAKIEATRLLTAALRKNGDWKAAATASHDLAKLLGDDTDDALRWDAIGEVLATSRDGVYPPPAETREGEDETVRRLDDDGALDAALAHLADERAEKLVAKARAIQTARTPVDVIKAFAEVAEGYRQVRVLSPGRSPDEERGVAEKAGAKLEGMAKTTVPMLMDKAHDLERTIAERDTINSSQRKEVAEYQDLCRDVAEAEGTFRESLSQIGGPGWGERPRLMGESVRRQSQYGRLALPFRRILNRRWSR